MVPSKVQQMYRIQGIALNVDSLLTTNVVCGFLEMINASQK